MADTARGHVIVVGNEKGGAGKSTVAVHLAVALSHAGLTVSAIDIDHRQKSFARYMENRTRWMAKAGAALPTPQVQVLTPSAARSLDSAERAEEDRFRMVLEEARAAVDIVLIDAPGRDSWMSRLAHGAADTLVTPINDSFLDFDLLGQADPDKPKDIRPSIYSEMVWEARKQKSLKDRRAIDWVVLRNRMSSLDARNKRRVGDALGVLSKRLGFRIAPGLSERVIYRELFLSGLTTLDVSGETEGVAFSMGHVAARQELRELIDALRLPMLGAGREGLAA